MAEISTPVDLCTSRGRLNPAAVGWSRQPRHTANLRGWGRTKRWEYWGLVTPEAIIGATISSVDYAGVHSLYVLDRRSGAETVHGAVEPLARSVALPDRCGPGSARARSGDLALEFHTTGSGTHLRVDAPGLRLDADVAATGADCLGVVVPWSPRLFQYTVKDVGRPLTGSLTLGGERLDFGPGSFAVLDHGRGRWPYKVTWNWAAGYGLVEGRAVGVQLGGQWTDRTGSTENGLLVDGRLHKVEEDLAWTYDRSDWAAPWRISGARVQVTLTPFHVRTETTNLGVVASAIHQAFGHFSGWIADDAGERIPVDGVTGWAEEARNRW